MLTIASFVLFLTVQFVGALHIHQIASMNSSTDSTLFVKHSASAGFMTSMLTNFPNLTHNVSNTNNEDFLVIQKTIEAIEHIRSVNESSLLIGPSFTEPATICINTLRANMYNDTSAFLLMTGDAIHDLHPTYSALSTIDLRTKLMVQMLDAFHWEHIDILHINNQFGSDYYDSLIRSIGDKNISVLSSAFQNEEGLQVSLRSVGLSKRRIVILVTGIQFAAKSLEFINTLGIFNNEYVWLVDGVFQYNQSQLPVNWFQFAPTGYTNQTKYDEVNTLYQSLYTQTSAIFPFASSAMIPQTLWGFTLGEYLTNLINGASVVNFQSVFGLIEESTGFLNTGHTIQQPKLGKSTLYNPTSIISDDLNNSIRSNFSVLNNYSFAFVLDSCGTPLQFRQTNGVCVDCPTNEFNFFGDGQDMCFPCANGDTISVDGMKCVNLEDGEGVSTTVIIIILLSTLIPALLALLAFLAYKRYKLLQVENQLIKTNYENQIRFVDFLCHEIRNPLNIVFSYLQFSIDSLKDTDEEFNPHQILTELEKCVFSCEHAIDILNNVLSVSKIQNNDVITKLEKFDILQTIAHVLKMLDHTKNENVQVKTIVDGMYVDLHNTNYIREILADQRMIKQILLNLIINAFKFTTNGFVEISVNENSRMGTVVSVTDTGIGLSDHAYKYVMNPEANTYNGKGNGIGLYVVHEYLKCLGSKLVVQSPLPNGLQGSMFQFSMKLFDSKVKYNNPAELNINEMQSSRSSSSFSNNESPKDVVLEMKEVLKQGEESPRIEQIIVEDVDDVPNLIYSSETKTPEVKTLHILVVDDSSLNVKIIIRTLTKFFKKESEYKVKFVKGYSLKDIQGRIQALEHYDMVIFDQNLQSNQTVTMKSIPGEEEVISVGSEMLRHMKKLPLYKDTVGIIYSGSVQQTDLELYKSHGADYVLKKPLQITEKFKQFIRQKFS